VSGAGFGRIDRRRTRGRLRRLHEPDRQRRAAYNLLRGRMSPQTVAAQARARQASARRARRQLRVAVAEELSPTAAELAAGSELEDIMRLGRKAGVARPAMEWMRGGD